MTLKQKQLDNQISTPLEQTLTGTVDRLLFKSTDTGYSVFVLQLNNQESATICCSVPDVNPGEHMSVKGSWVTHPKFGRQFQATTCTAHAPTSIIGLKKYLGSGLIKGIGPSYAEKLVDYFGNTVLDIIDKTPERLSEVRGIGGKRIEQIINAWKDQKEISNIMVFLQEKNVSTAYAVKIYKKYGQYSLGVLNENPYRIADEIWGIGFKIADQIAQKLGIAPDSIKRIKAGLQFAITTAIGNGHLYVELEDLKQTTHTLLELDNSHIAHTLTLALHELYNEDKIKLITHDDKHFVTLTKYYFSEKGVAQRIKTLITYPCTTLINVDTAYERIRVQKHEHDIVLNEQQQKGILSCLSHKITIITGGPGTGKTTLIKKLLQILDEQNVRYKLAAPTGRAAKRITESTRKHASTLHRLLEFDAGSLGFTRNEHNALPLDFLIVDEASMIDIFLAHALIKALPHSAHLILLGDVDQLPSVGAGNFLNDLIASKTVAVTRLTEIFRQAQDSLIIVNAHRVNKGEFPTSSLPGSKKDFIFIKEDDPHNAQTHMNAVFKTTLKRYGISTHDAMVLVPMNRGIVGTHTINHNLQTLLNDDATKKTLALAHVTYKVGDRVMQIRNNYDKHVYNGDVGLIDDIDAKERIIYVIYDNHRVEYEASDVHELVLAYAISIHKSQGSEYDAVIIPVFMQHFALLQRNLIYTAITRAKKLCIFIGQSRAIAMAIKNNKAVQRTTFLQEFLTTDLACR